jgi:hypothetical protein
MEEKAQPGLQDASQGETSVSSLEFAELNVPGAREEAEAWVDADFRLRLERTQRAHRSIGRRALSQLRRIVTGE